MAAVVWQNLIGAMLADFASGVNAIAGLISAVLSGIAAIYAIRAHIESAAAKVGVAEVKTDVHKIEVATNSMKEAQVDLASKLGLAEGEKKGRADVKAEIKQDAQDAKATPERMEPQITEKSNTTEKSTTTEKSSTTLKEDIEAVRKTVPKETAKLVVKKLSEQQGGP